jgi:hypothetical protein
MMFVGFRIINGWLYVYVANDKQAIKSFQKSKDISKRKWYFKRYGLYDYIRMATTGPMLTFDDLNTIYDYDELVKALSTKCKLDLNNANEVTEFLRAPKYQIHERILQLLITTLAPSYVQHRVDIVMKELKERDELKRSVFITEVNNKHIVNLIEKKGTQLFDDVIFYKAKERYILYHGYSHVALFIPHETSAEDFVEAIINIVKESSWALEYIKIILKQIASYVEYIPDSDAKKLGDYAVAALMVMD